MEKGVLVVISGFAGAGKGTVIKELREQHPSYELSISATSREIRHGEQEGITYFYKTKEQFEEMIRQGKFVEYTKYCGYYYGTLKEYVEPLLDQGIDVILEVEVEGALHVKETYPDALLIFITPPSARELKRRLIDRGREDETAIWQRMERAVEESRYMDCYGYIAVNETGKKTECAREIHEVIQGTLSRGKDNAQLIQAIQEGLREEVVRHKKECPCE